MNTFNVKHIIVGLDFSDYSFKVVHEAQVLAKKMKVPLVYVHSYEDPRWPTDLKGEVLKSMPEQIRITYHLGSSADIRIGFGNAVQFILETADSLPNPLIVVGHKGKNPLVRFVVGSTAEKLAQISRYPVWVQRGDRIVLPQKLLIPSDLGRQTNRTVKQVQNLSESLKPEIELFHVTEEPIPLMEFNTWNYIYGDIMANEDKKFRQFKNNHPDLKVVREQGFDVAATIRSHAEARNFDVVVVSPTGKGKSFPFWGHVTARLVRSSENPVLVCH